jgi:hypothetical protein
MKTERRKQKTTWMNATAKTPFRRPVPVGYDRARLRLAAERIFSVPVDADQESDTPAEHGAIESAAQ